MTSFYGIVWIHAVGLKWTLVSKGAKPNLADNLEDIITLRLAGFTLEPALDGITIDRV